MTSWDIMNNLSTYSIVSSVLSLSWSFTAHEAVQMKGALDFSVNAIGRFLIICSSLAQVSQFIIVKTDSPMEEQKLNFKNPQIIGRLLLLVMLNYCTGIGHFWPSIAFVAIHVILYAICATIIQVTHLKYEFTTKMFLGNIFNGLAKILGCRDPRYKHENPSISKRKELNQTKSIMNDKS